MIGLPSMPGLWPDEYYCTKGRVIETINRMLRDNEPDFPITACGGFTITKTNGGLYKIYPKIIRKEFLYDTFTKRIKER